MPPRVTQLVDPAATPSSHRLAWLASGRAGGLWMKAKAVLHAHGLAPDLALLTDTATDNVPMRQVDDTLDYRPTHTSI